jgi:hypothetical protein
MADEGGFDFDRLDELDRQSTAGDGHDVPF